MTKSRSAAQLWRMCQQHNSLEKSLNCPVFEPDTRSDLPNLAKRFFHHSIQAGTSLATAVRLRMHGEIKLNEWLPFQAEQVIWWPQGMVWQATVKMKGLPLRGSDSWLDGKGRMQWRLLGLIPVMQAEGEDISRSAIGRMIGECMWLPSVLYQFGEGWSVADNVLQTDLSLGEETVRLNLQLGDRGQLVSIKYQRWGNPADEDFHYESFGGLIESEATFGGYTIPKQIRGGWYFGTENFLGAGEFFRAEIDEASYL